MLGMTQVCVTSHRMPDSHSPLLFSNCREKRTYHHSPVLKSGRETTMKNQILPDLQNGPSSSLLASSFHIHVLPCRPEGLHRLLHLSLMMWLSTLTQMRTSSIPTVTQTEVTFSLLNQMMNHKRKPTPLRSLQFAVVVPLRKRPHFITVIVPLRKGQLHPQWQTHLCRKKTRRRSRSRSRSRIRFPSVFHEKSFHRLQSSKTQSLGSMKLHS
jgi:hypothetical protein